MIFHFCHGYIRNGRSKVDLTQQADLRWSFTTVVAKWATKKKNSYFPWNPGWLIGILTLAYYNPYMTGYYNPLHPNNQGPFFHCSSNVWQWLPSASTVASSKSWCRTGWWNNHAKVVLPGHDPEKKNLNKNGELWIQNHKHTHVYICILYVYTYIVLEYDRI